MNSISQPDFFVVTISDSSGDEHEHWAFTDMPEAEDCEKYLISLPYYGYDKGFTSSILPCQLGLDYKR